MKKNIVLLFFILLLVSCLGLPSCKESVVYYEPSDEVIANPERGFYSAFELRPNFEPLTVDFVRNNRAEGRSLIYLGFYLTDFMESDISDEFLGRVEACFKALREGGNKCILRFAYRCTKRGIPGMPRRNGCSGISSSSVPS